MCVCVYRVVDDREILRNQLTQLWRLPSLKSAGQAGRLATPARADVQSQVQRQSGGRISSSLGNLRVALQLLDEAHPYHGG